MSALQPEDDTLDQFLRIMLHELRNSLQALHITISLLKKQLGPELDPKSQQHLDRVMRVRNELDQVLATAGAYRRILNQEVKLQSVDLNEVIDQIRSIGDWRQSDTISIEGDLPTVTGDPALLQLIFETLIRNALQYNDQGHPKAMISATACDNDRSIGIVVKDNGIGIAPAHLTNLFQPFQRFNQNYGDGVGMGLLMAKTAAERLGGTITVTSTPGSGSQFTVCLPSN